MISGLFTQARMEPIQIPTYFLKELMRHQSKNIKVIGLHFGGHYEEFDTTLNCSLIVEITTNGKTFLNEISLEEFLNFYQESGDEAAAARLIGDLLSNLETSQRLIKMYRLISLLSTLQIGASILQRNFQEGTAVITSKCKNLPFLCYDGLTTTIEPNEA